MRILVAILVAANSVVLGTPTAADAQDFRSCVNAQFTRWCLRPDPNGGPCITVDRQQLAQVTRGCICSATTGQECFESYIAEFENQANAHNGDPDFNSRKPWSINKYGLLQGGTPAGPDSVGAPDDFPQYGNNKYCYMWGHRNGYGNWPRAGVDLPLESTVEACILRDAR